MESNFDMKGMKAMKELTETILLENLVREAIQNPTLEQIEEYGIEWVSKNFSRIGNLKVHWQYARYTNDYRIAHFCNRCDANTIHATTNRTDMNSPDGVEHLFISLDTEIKKLRTASKMTQKEFSDYFNIPRRSIEDWETEKRTPPEYLVKLIEYKLRAEGKIQ